jgi:AraC family transcriptional regulator
VCELVETSMPRRPSLALLAREASVHPAHLGRVFRAHLGCSPGDYTQERRVVMAQGFLRDTDMPLARLAVRVGFFDQSHFTRVFRARVGETPGAFRARVRGLNQRSAS